MNDKRILHLFTRTPLHVGAGASVGAIDQPIQRERHTGFPIIPASSLKGSFADYWNETLVDGKRGAGEAAWLFGSDDANSAAAGALLFGEARLLAFPIRSAKGSFAWITSPLLLRRAARDGVIPANSLAALKEPADNQAVFDAGTTSKLALGSKIVLEEYTFEAAGWLGLHKLGEHLATLLKEDSVWSEITSRLVILSDGMMSFFAQNACEVAQHVRISDETGTADGGGLFNQENVPSETLFYAVLNATKSRLSGNGYKDKTAAQALEAFSAKIGGDKPVQFGGDASTGLGYCTVKLS
jgi:CRISPR-associated protein Cmr4